MGAADGSLAIMVGGSEEAFAAARPALDVMGSAGRARGDRSARAHGSSSRATLMHFVSFSAAMEASRLAEAAGLDVAELGRVVRHTDAVTGGPGAIMLRDTTAPSPRTTSGSASWSNAGAGEKDLGFAIALADELGVDVPLARQALPRPGSELGRQRASSTTCRRSADADSSGMEEVYGFEMTDGSGDFFRYTADHLFADIWNRPGLSDRDRRLLLIGMLAGTNQHDVLTIQIPRRTPPASSMPSSCARS